MISDDVNSKIDQSFSNLNAWIDTWEKDGGINGFIVHQHNDKMDSMIPDCLTLSSCILAYLNIYNKNRQNNKKWLLKAEKTADYLASIYIMDAHVFSASSYEHKPCGDTLVYEGLATFALLRMYSIIEKKKYLDVAKDSVDNLLVGKYWDSENGMFWNLLKDGRKIHALNMGGMTIAAIVEYVRLTGDESYMKYALGQADFVMKYQEKEGFLKGAYYYDDAGTWNRVMSLYIAWTLRGMIELYDYKRDEKYLDSIKKVLDFTYSKMFDSENGIFYHRFMIRRYGKIELKKGPEWIAAAGACIYCFARVRDFGLEYDLDSIYGKVIDYQYPSGGFPNCRFYHNMFVPKIVNNKNGEINWRDAIPIVGWNSQMFEALSVSVRDVDIEPSIKFPFEYQCDDGYIFSEDENTFKIIKESDVVALYNKQNPSVFYIGMKNLANSVFCQKDMAVRGVKFKMKLWKALSLFLIYMLIVSYLMF